MPKIKPLTETQEVRQRLTQNIALIQGGLPGKEFASHMGMSVATFNRKKKDPESFTLSEVRLMCKFAHVPLDAFLTQSLKVGV